MRCVNCGEPVAFGEDHECPDKPVLVPDRFCVECGERITNGRRCTYHQNVKDGFG